MSVGRAGSLIATGAVLLASLVVGEGRGAATPLTVSLDYAARPDCPGVEEFRSVVAARLGYDPFRPGAPERVRVTITTRGAALDGAIEWRDAAGRWTGDQTFPAVTTGCSRLAQAIGLALAVQIQLLAGARESAAAGVAASPAGGASAGGETPAPNQAPGVTAAAPPSSRPSASSAPPAVTSPAPAPSLPVPASPPPPPAEEAPPPPSPREEQPPPALSEPAAAKGPASDAHAGATFAIGAGPTLGLGLASSPSALGHVFGALAWRRLSIELAAAASVPATTRRQDGAGYSQQLLFGGAAACGVLGRASACGLVNAGLVRLAGKDIDHPTTGRVVFLQPGVRASVSHPVAGPWFVRGRVDALLNVVRWTVSLDEVPVWTAPRFAATVGVDLGARL